MVLFIRQSSVFAASVHCWALWGHKTFLSDTSLRVSGEGHGSTAEKGEDPVRFPGNPAVAGQEKRPDLQLPCSKFARFGLAIFAYTSSFTF
jgi:hypothetical protein